MDSPSRRFAARIVVFACLGLILPPKVAAQEEAGRIAFAIGQVTVTDIDGRVRQVSRGSTVYSGDTLKTDSGRAQVRFNDGGFISLVPDTTFTIEDYRFRDTEEAASRSFFRLVKGGLRALTGAIGRKFRENYELRTAVATIGIRGTNFRATLTEVKNPGWQLLVSVGVPMIRAPGQPTGARVTNAWGSLDVDPGENALVEINQAPRLTSEQALVAAAEVRRGHPDAQDKKVAKSNPLELEPKFLAGEQTNESGQQLIAVGQITTRTPVSIAASEVYIPFDSLPSVELSVNNTDAVAFFKDGQPIGAISSEVPSGSDDLHTIDLDGMLAVDDPTLQARVRAFVDGLDASGKSIVDSFRQNPAKVLEFDNTTDAALFWGRWGEGEVLAIEETCGSPCTFSADTDLYENDQSLHFVGGTAFSGSLPTTGSATYNFIGGTQSTALDGSSIGQGATAGSLTVTFLTGKFDLDMTIVHNSTYVVSTAGDPGTLDGSGPFKPFFSGSVVPPSFGTIDRNGIPCSTCSFGYKGFLGGPASSNSQPSRAGVSYDLADSPLKITGAAGFRQ